MMPFTVTALLLLFSVPLSHGQRVNELKRFQIKYAYEPAPECLPDLKTCYRQDDHHWPPVLYVGRNPRRCNFFPCPDGYSFSILLSNPDRGNIVAAPETNKAESKVPGKMPNDKPIEEPETTPDQELGDVTKDSELKDEKPTNVKNKEPVSETKPGRGSSRLRRQHKKNGHR